MENYGGGGGGGMVTGFKTGSAAAQAVMNLGS